MKRYAFDPTTQTIAPGENTMNVHGTIQAAAQMNGETFRSESELEAIGSRIHRLATVFEDIGGNLERHADAVHGSIPNNAAGVAAAPVRTGQLGAIYDALDRLERVQAYVSEQAGRNCTLA